MGTVLKVAAGVVLVGLLLFAGFLVFLADVVSEPETYTTRTAEAPADSSAVLSPVPAGRP